MRAVGLCLLWAIGACLNPLPEEFPSNDDARVPPTATPNPGAPGDDNAGAGSGTPQAPSAGGLTGADEPPASSSDDGDEEGRADSSVPDAGVDAGADDAGTGSPDAARAADLE